MGNATQVVGRLVRRFLSAVPSPLWHSAVLLLYYCTHVHGFVGCWWWMGFSAVYSRALLLYYMRTAVLLFVVQGCGWVDRFVGVSTGSWVIIYTPEYIYFPLYQPRAGIVRRTTSKEIFLKSGPWSSKQNRLQKGSRWKKTE